MVQGASAATAHMLCSAADDAFAAAEEAGAAAAAEARAKATGRRGGGNRGRGVRGDAAAERAKEILAAGADAVLTLGEDRDAPRERDRGGDSD
jgi:hypothetical protein